jgi:hypothetical protein
MTDSLDWLRPHFDRIVEEYWATTKMAYRLEPELKTLTGEDVQRALHELLGARPDVLIEQLDAEYRTYSRAVFEQVIADDKTNRSMAWADRQDCDDFAWQFKGNMRWWFNVNAVGFVVDRSSLHAYSVICFDNGTASLFEPQEDRFVGMGDPIALITGAPSLQGVRDSIA